MLRNHLLNSSSVIGLVAQSPYGHALTMAPEGDTPAGGGGAQAAAPAAGTSSQAAPAGQASTTPEAGAADTSLLSAAADPDKNDQPAANKEGEKDPPAETPEQKAERLKNETPEAKAEREAKEKEAADKKTAEVLKTYDTLKLPEGMKADQPAIVDFKKEAAALGLEAASAQKLVDAVAPKLLEAVNAPYNAWAKTQEEWVAAAKTHKEYGGADFEKNMGVAAKAMDAFGPELSKSLREVLAFTGAGNNPHVIEWMYRVGKGYSEGGNPGGRPAGGQGSLAQSMYPTMGATE